MPVGIESLSPLSELLGILYFENELLLVTNDFDLETSGFISMW